jgi:hypothetical protein
MWQKSQVTRASADKPGKETEQGLSIERMELVESCSPKPGNGRRLAGFCWKLCTCLFHRWFNLYDLGLEEDLYVSPVLRRFAGAGLCHAAASHETAILRSGNLPEQNDFLQAKYSAALPEGERKSGIPWKSPWLYLSLVLLAWLFVL